MKAYNKSAKYYDLIYRDKDYGIECDFLEEIFARFCKNKPRTLLDMACGTGNHAIELAKRGYHLTAIDSSPQMISIAMSKMKRWGLAINFKEMAMQEMKFDSKFDIIICMFSSIDYLVDYADLKKVLSNVYAHLKKEGLFVFDFWSGFALYSSFSPTRVKIVENKGLKVIRVSNTVVKPIQQLCEIDSHYIILQEGQVIDEFREKHIKRFSFPLEMKNYLLDTGFEVRCICPFLDLDRQVDDRDWYIAIVAQKRKTSP